MRLRRRRWPPFGRSLRPAIVHCPPMSLPLGRSAHANPPLARWRLHRPRAGRRPLRRHVPRAVGVLRALVAPPARRMRAVGLVALVLALAPAVPPATAPRAAAGWIPLFDGRSTAGWQMSGPGRLLRSRAARSSPTAGWGCSGTSAAASATSSSRSTGGRAAVCELGRLRPLPGPAGLAAGRRELGLRGADRRLRPRRPARSGPARSTTSRPRAGSPRGPPASGTATASASSGSATPSSSTASRVTAVQGRTRARRLRRAAEPRRLARASPSGGFALARCSAARLRRSKSPRIAGAYAYAVNAKGGPSMRRPARKDTHRQAGRATLVILAVTAFMLPDSVVQPPPPHLAPAATREPASTPTAAGHGPRDTGQPRRGRRADRGAARRGRARPAPACGGTRSAPRTRSARSHGAWPPAWPPTRRPPPGSTWPTTATCSAWTPPPWPAWRRLLVRPIGAGAVVHLRQRFGDLPAGHDGLVSILVTRRHRACTSAPRCPGTPARPRRRRCQPPTRRTRPRSRDAGLTADQVGQPRQSGSVAVPTPAARAAGRVRGHADRRGRASTRPRSPPTWTRAPASVLVREDLVDFDSDNPQLGGLPGHPAARPPAPGGPAGDLVR